MSQHTRASSRVILAVVLAGGCVAGTAAPDVSDLPQQSGRAWSFTHTMTRGTDWPPFPSATTAVARWSDAARTLQIYMGNGADSCEARPTGVVEVKPGTVEVTFGPVGPITSPCPAMLVYSLTEIVIPTVSDTPTTLVLDRGSLLPKKVEVPVTKI